MIPATSGISKIPATNRIARQRTSNQSHSSAAYQQPINRLTGLSNGESYNTWRAHRPCESYSLSHAQISSQVVHAALQTPVLSLLLEKIELCVSQLLLRLVELILDRYLVARLVTQACHLLHQSGYLPLVVASARCHP